MRHLENSPALSADNWDLASTAPAEELDGAAWTGLQRAVRGFEQVWMRGERPAIDDYLRAKGVDRLLLLVELVHAELELRLKAGEPAKAEEYFQRYPELAEDPQKRLELRVSEAEFRRRAGDEPVNENDDKPDSAKALLGRYELRKLVGRGSSGVVYQAWDPVLERVVAVKILRPGRSHTPQDEARFLRKARSSAGLSHRNLVTVHDAGVIGETYYLTSEFISGKTLGETLATDGLSFRESAAILCQVAEGLAHAHALGVVHRDLKPSNIMVDESGQPRVMDFGLAKHDAATDSVTIEGEVIGTPAYLSPEQARGEAGRVDGRADVYSLGVILYQMLTAELPFRGTTRMLLHQVLHDEPRAPRRLNDQVPRDLETICLKAMCKDLEGRYASARNLADDLRHYLAGEPIKARPVTSLERGIRWARRRPAIAALSTAVVAITVIGFLGIVWQWRQAERARLLASDRAESEGLARTELEANLYRYRIALADRELEAKNAARAGELLEQCRPGERGWEWRYLLRKQTRRVSTKPMLEEPVRIFDVAYSGDQKILATGGWDGQTRLHDATTGRLIRTLEGHTEPVHTVSFSPDGSTLATCAGDGTVKLWDYRSGREIHTIGGHNGGAWDVAFSPDGRLVASGDSRGRLLVSDVASGLLLWSIQAHADRIWDLDFSPEGDRLATASADGRVIIWESKSPTKVMTLNEGVEFPLFCLSFSPDGSCLASSGASGVVKYWDTRSGVLKARNRLYNCTVLSLAFSPDGARLAFAGTDHSVTICEAETTKELIRLYGHSQEVWGLAFSPDGTRLASVGWDRSVHVWDASPVADSERPEFMTLKGHDGNILDVDFRADGKEVASGGDDGMVHLWNLSTGRESAQLRGHKGGITCLAYVTEGKLLVTGSWDRTALVWDIASQRIVHRLASHQGAVDGVACSPDGRRIATSSWDRSVRIWDTSNGRCLHVLPESKGYALDVAYSPDGRLLASSSVGVVRLWDPETGRLVKSLDAPADTMTSIAFSPDSRRLAAAGREPTVTVWDIESTEKLMSLQSDQMVSHGLAISPDGRLIVSAGWDRSIRIWEFQTGRFLTTLQGHTDRLFGLAISPDGTLMASSGGDQTIRLWKLPQGSDDSPKSPASGH